MVHVIGCTCDSGVVPSALPDKLEEVVDAGENVVHEDDSFKVFIFRIAKVVEGTESGVSDFGEVFDSVVECPARPHDVLMATRRPTDLVRASKMRRRALVWSVEPFS